MSAERLQQARCLLLAHAPWYGHAAMSITWIASSRTATMGVRLVDGGDVQYLYNPAFVAELTVLELFAVSACAAVQSDRSRVAVLHPIGRQCLDLLRQATQPLHGWGVEYYGPVIQGESVFVLVFMQPPSVRVIFPDVRYRLTITADVHGECQVAVSTNGRTIQSRVPTPLMWEMAAPDAWRTQSWPAAEVSHAISLATQHLGDFLLDRLLPVESAAASPEARQAMLILVPLRLAETARNLREVAWCQELVDVCLLGLGHQPVSPRIVVRQLFFQLLRLLLADREHRESAHEQYELLGLKLAGMRRTDANLPYNPVFAYDRYCHGRANLDHKLTPQDRVNYAWFLEQVTLEQVVDLMSLT